MSACNKKHRGFVTRSKAVLLNKWTLCAAIIGVSVWLVSLKEQPKRKTCDNISVVCDCDPKLCRCGGIKTCSESCYQEAKRQGRVK